MTIDERTATEPAVVAAVLDYTVEDIHATIASATVRSAVYREYVHLARTADGWKIVNTLWAPT